MFSTTMYPKLKTTHQITHHAILNLRYVEIVKNPCRSRVDHFNKHLLLSFLWERRFSTMCISMHAFRLQDHGLVSQYIGSAPAMQASMTSTTSGE